jgi:hypothetical protein
MSAEIRARYVVGWAILFVAIFTLIAMTGSCLTFQNGALINGCGLWQNLTGQKMIVAFGDLPVRNVVVEKVVVQTKLIPSPPQIVYVPEKPKVPTREEIERSGRHVVGEFIPEKFYERGTISCENGKLKQVSNINLQDVPRALDAEILQQLCQPR